MVGIWERSCKRVVHVDRSFLGRVSDRGSALAGVPWLMGPAPTNRRINHVQRYAQVLEVLAKHGFADLSQHLGLGTLIDKGLSVLGAAPKRQAIGAEAYRYVAKLRAWPGSCQAARSAIRWSGNILHGCAILLKRISGFDG